MLDDCSGVGERGSTATGTRKWVPAARGPHRVPESSPPRRFGPPSPDPPGPGGRRLRWVLRAALLGLAGLQLHRGLPGLSTTGHIGADLAAWQVAVAVGLATVAIRPGVVDALMPMMAGGTVMTVLVSVRDVAAARTSAHAEFSHLTLVAAFAVLTLLWLSQHD